jgi:hypothetical protein
MDSRFTHQGMPAAVCIVDASSWHTVCPIGLRHAKEKDTIEEMKTTTSAFSKTGVDFEFNVWYLLPIKIVKFHLFTLVLRKFIEKMEEEYSDKIFTEYFDEIHKNTSIPKPAIKVQKAFFLVNIKKNVVQSIIEMLNNSQEGENKGFNKEFFTELQNCIDNLDIFISQHDLQKNSETIKLLNAYKLQEKNHAKSTATGSPMDMMLYTDTPPFASATPTVFRLCSFLT